MPNSSMFVFPSNTPPRSRNRAIALASTGDLYPLSTADPAVVVPTDAHRLSFAANGTPSTADAVPRDPVEVTALARLASDARASANPRLACASTLARSPTNARETSASTSARRAHCANKSTAVSSFARSARAASSIAFGHDGVARDANDRAVEDERRMASRARARRDDDDATRR